MEYWENVIKAALLGTQKKVLATESLPEVIRKAVSEQTQPDAEELFLKIASLATQYVNAGTRFPGMQLIFQPSEPEEWQVAPTQLISLLKNTLSENQGSLLADTIRLMATKSWRITEDLLPDLLDKGKNNPNLQKTIKKVAGKRGAWLAQFNPDWQYMFPASPEEIWQTGKPEERKKVLAELRLTNPALAREWLLDVWRNENANTKSSFLSVFSNGLSMEDEPMLESILQDKSQKVRETAANLLFLLPNSRLIERVWQQTHTWIRVEDLGRLLGLGAKRMVLKLILPDSLSQDLIKDGIEPSKEKLLKEFASSGEVHKRAVASCMESETWLYQVLLAIPAHRWYKHLDISPDVFVSLFLHDDFSKFIPALSNAAILHKEVALIKALLVPYINGNRHVKQAQQEGLALSQQFSLIYALPPAERSHYLDELLALFGTNNYQFFQYVSIFNYTWPLDFSLRVLQIIANKCSANRYYYFDVRQIQGLSEYFPTAVLEHFNQLAPADEMAYSRWQQVTQPLHDSLELKNQMELALSL